MDIRTPQMIADELLRADQRRRGLESGCILTDDEIETAMRGTSRAMPRRDHDPRPEPVAKSIAGMLLAGCLVALMFIVAGVLA